MNDVTNLLRLGLGLPPVGEVAAVTIASIDAGIAVFSEILVLVAAPVLLGVIRRDVAKRVPADDAGNLRVAPQQVGLDAILEDHVELARLVVVRHHEVRAKAVVELSHHAGLIHDINDLAVRCVAVAIPDVRDELCLILIGVVGGQPSRVDFLHHGVELAFPIQQVRGPLVHHDTPHDDTRVVPVATHHLCKSLLVDLFPVIVFDRLPPHVLGHHKQANTIALVDEVRVIRVVRRADQVTSGAVLDQVRITAVVTVGTSVADIGILLVTVDPKQADLLAIQVNPGALGVLRVRSDPAKSGRDLMLVDDVAIDSDATDKLMQVGVVQRPEMRILDSVCQLEAVRLSWRDGNRTGAR